MLRMVSEAEYPWLRFKGAKIFSFSPAMSRPSGTEGLVSFEYRATDGAASKAAISAFINPDPLNLPGGASAAPAHAEPA